MKLKDENNVVERRGGIVWKNLKVCGSGSSINLQKNIGSLLLSPFRPRELFGKSHEKTILNEFNGCLKSGEMLVVLGRPGSGCSTLLKTLMGELHGLDMKEQSTIHYNGTVSCPRPFDRLLMVCRHNSKANVEAVQRRAGLQPGSR